VSDAPAVRRVWLALGANLGDRLANLRGGLDALVAGGVALDAVSSVYDTPAWPAGEGAPRYANIAASGETALTPHALLRLAKQIEVAAGRDLDAPRNSARPLDVDILAIEGELVSTPDLEVPHVRMHERAFVLMPLLEIEPEFVHPRLGRAAELLAGLDRDDITTMASPGWWVPGA
jgi:2-amino-4-hydroxy-6-hydroxymethyldihydropteridine diphosphokinase